MESMRNDLTKSMVLVTESEKRGILERAPNGTVCIMGVGEIEAIRRGQRVSGAEAPSSVCWSGPALRLGGILRVRGKPCFGWRTCASRRDSSGPVGLWMEGRRSGVLVGGERD